VVLNSRSPELLAAGRKIYVEGEEE
jgi:hypothetical protein